MKQAVLFLFALAVAALVALYVAYDAFHQGGGEEESRRPIPRLDEPEELESAGTPEARTAPPRGARAWAITGSVLEVAGDGLPGLTLVLGDEETVTGAGGAFRFSEAVRSSSMPLRVLSGTTELCRWESVVAGTEAPARGSAAPPDYVQEVEAADLQRIRWTVNLLPAPKGPTTAVPWIRATCVLCEDWGLRSRIRVQGVSRLPDGAFLASFLSFDDQRLLAATRPAEVLDGRFEQWMESPGGFKLFSGDYDLGIVYSMALQRVEMVQKWAAEHPEVSWVELDVPEVHATVFFGDRREAFEEDREIDAYYGRQLAAVQRLDRTLKSRVEEVLDLAHGWDPAALRRLVDAAHFAEIAAGTKNWDPSLLAIRQQARTLWCYTETVENGVFVEERWRRFLDDQWRPAIDALRREHAARPRAKYPQAASRLSILLDALRMESNALSMFLVYPSDVPSHAKDFYPDEEREGDLGLMERRIRDSYEQIQKYTHLTSF